LRYNSDPYVKIQYRWQDHKAIRHLKLAAQSVQTRIESTIAIGFPLGSKVRESLEYKKFDLPAKFRQFFGKDQNSIGRATVTQFY
jgi:hypothetical protein